MVGTFNENPVLQREFRSRLSSRKQSKGVRIATAVVALSVVLLLYYYGARVMLRNNMTARDLYTVIAYIQMTLIVFMAPSLTANAITQEREQQTWNALLLTRLTGDEIILGKLIARLFPAAVLIALFVPLSILAAFLAGIPVVVVLHSYLVVCVTTVTYGTIGLFCSWAFRRTSMATSAATGIIAFLVAGTFLLCGLWSSARFNMPSRFEDFAPMWLNPYMALWVALDANTTSCLPTIVNLAASASASMVLLATMIRRIARGPKELE